MYGNGVPQQTTYNLPLPLPQPPQPMVHNPVFLLLVDHGTYICNPLFQHIGSTLLTQIKGLVKVAGWAL